MTTTPEAPNPVIPRPTSAMPFASTCRPLAPDPAWLPSMLRSSIVTSPRVNAGSADKSEIVPMPDEPGSMMSWPLANGSELTAWIAARSDPVPESSLFCTR